jgi:SnoaL-like domain
MPDTDDFDKRLSRLEDESAIRYLMQSYGPAADAGLTALAADCWVPDGVYDWDAQGQPYNNRVEVDQMLQSELHQSLIANGVAHFHGAPLIDIGEDTATGLSYSMVMRRDVETAAFYLWRLSAVRWDFERAAEGWLIRRRTHRLLDETGGGRELFKQTLGELFGARAR